MRTIATALITIATCFLFGATVPLQTNPCVCGKKCSCTFDKQCGCLSVKESRVVLDYGEACKEAVKDGMPLIVFVNYERFDVSECKICTVKSFPDVPSSCIVLAVPDGHGWLTQKKVLNGTHSWTALEVRIAMGIATQHEINAAKPVTLQEAPSQQPQTYYQQPFQQVPAFGGFRGNFGGGGNCRS